MNKIDFLRTSTAVSLALVVHLVTFYGIAAATPVPRHPAILVGPVSAVQEVISPRLASRATRAPAG